MVALFLCFFGADTMTQNRTILGAKEQWTSHSGVSVTFVGESHKHADDGDTLGVWHLRFEKQGEKPRSVELRGMFPEAEIAAFGQLFLVNPAKVAGRLRVAEEPLQKKMSEDAAVESAEKLGKDLKHNGSRMHEDNGIYSVTLYDGTKDVLRVRIGAYTKRVLANERVP